MMIGRILFCAEAGLRRVIRALKSARYQRVAWAVAVIVFLGGFVASVASQPKLVSDFHLNAALVIVFFFCPAMTVINMATTKEIARLAGVKMGLSVALKLAIMSAAANHLPVPGGPLLRTAAMQAAGGRLKDAGLANVTAGISWMSGTCLFVGASALLLDTLLAIALFGLGLVLFAVTFGAARLLPGRFLSLMRLTITNLISAAIYALSIYVALHAFGAAWSFSEAAVVAAAGVIGAASSITPSGLGVREIAAAGLASLIGADPAAAFAATAAVHVAMAAFTGVISIYFFARGKAVLLTT